tara:strand:- start:332 stop:559 length:228 start_codon:yes stop_codon:yes gene_type:complete
MKDRRSPNQQAAEKIPEELARQARTQLESEISILKSWLKDLNETREDNPESIIARNSYTEMLQNRQELLDTLNEH